MVTITSVDSLAELEGGEAEQHQDDGDDPEADNDLGLFPAAQLVVVMQRRHAEDPLAFGGFEITDLHHHGNGFCDEDTAHDEEHDFLTHDHGRRTECSTNRQRTHIAHEHLGRIRIEPEEAQTGPDQRPE